MISGGIGNQMFQYALYLALKSRGKQVYINIDTYDFLKMHSGFMLQRAFSIPKNDLITPNKLGVFTRRLFRKFMELLGLVFKENSSEQSEEIFNRKYPFIIGVFENEYYFKDIKEQILKVYTFKNIDPFNLNLSHTMQIEDSVSLHIRRGDYLKFSRFNVCGSEYYKQAIRYILSKVSAPVFYVFSDDPVWSENFMKEFDVNYHVIKHNTGVDSYKDMYLMTQCKHNILANSTFSWWGAWLNQNPTKLVVAPLRWFADSDVNPICKDWCIINN
jgi:hypothetical protein